MKKTTITCDSCEKDLTTTNHQIDYYFSLNEESKINVSGFATALHIAPPMGRNHHFCGLGCLKTWIK